MARMAQTSGPSRRGAVVAAGFVASWSVLLIVIHLMGSSEGTPHRLYASVAFGAPSLSIGLAVLAAEVRRTPWTVAAAGVALIPMGLGIFSLVGLPLVVPGSFLTWRGFVELESWPRTAPITAVALFALALGAIGALVLHDDPATWQTSGATHYSSDIVTATEATISLGLSALVVAVATIAPPLGLRR